MLTVTPIQDRDQWQALLTRFPLAHILQTWEWGEFKRITTGWMPERLVYCDSNGDAVAVVSLLTRQLGPVNLIYAPKGPVLDYSNAPVREAVLSHLEGLARQRRAVWLKIDPDQPIATGISSDETPDPARPDLPDSTGQALQAKLTQRGWRFSSDQVQFRNTLTLDLSLSEEDLLAQMSQSTRRKIRQAEKNGVTVRTADLESDDLQKLYDLYNVTGERQGFLIRPLDYYQTAWVMFTRAGLGHALIAESDGQAIGGVVLFYTGRKVWYFYGMSSNAHRDLQPNYLLQWTAIRWAKAHGYALYDWWGAPNQFMESDPMWGVYRFKDGFGGEVVRHLGAWDYAPYGWLYWAYEQARPRLLAFLRRNS